MSKPGLGADFTMDDLYKLREYNSMRHINMMPEELKDDIGKGAKEVSKRIEQLKNEKQPQHVNV